ncbi:MAG: sodium:proton antiporter NhaD [Bacteroidetes bacterium]|uniref:Sodium:proton antiporter NhaD n=1 Tax=Candidatus Caccoplasma merdipullorum TaxID=2840718 RepID=A0A9D9H7A6_9BACT|nr:sodium:proton antiporter NhaD [Candidatus Caccoplasma merdipullorum]
MIIAIIVVFILGYMAIALEHPLKVDKTASALFLGMLLWTMYAVGVLSGDIFPDRNMDLLNGSIIEHMGDISEILFFLIGAMTIVELIDVHGGFSVITERITTRKKRKLLWLLCFVTFFMSAVLDNLTTSIVMVMLLRKLISEQKERWIFGSMIVIAANSGGAWSPIGDITTIMLWVRGNVTTEGLLSNILLPSIVSMLVPLAIISTRLDKAVLPPVAISATGNDTVTKSDKNRFFIFGVVSLLLVPVFKSLTHLPPFIGVLFFLSLLWIYTEYYYNNKTVNKEREYRILRVLSRIDIPTILFFLGILMAVAVLQETGILANMALYLDEKVHNVYIINIVLGILSSIVDNVPLVAAAMGMYPLADPAALSSLPAAEAAYAMNFVQDGIFWEFLSYCAGVGGSMLIIGSAAGVVVMGLEKINFIWYLKNISLLALLGYLAGAAFYIFQVWLVGTLA